MEKMNRKGLKGVNYCKITGRFTNERNSKIL